MFHRSQLCTLRRLAPIAALAAAADVGSAQVGLGLAPMRLDLPVQQGQRQTGVLALTNESATPVRVRADLLDFRIDDSANPLFAPSLASESAYSCRNWLTVNPMEFEIGPNERRLVRYSLRVPNETGQGSFHCAVGFTAAAPMDGAGAIGMRTNVRVIAALYPMVGRVAPQGTIQDLAVRSGEEAAVTVINTGQQVFRAIGTMDILDASGQVTATQPLPTVPILPGRKQVLPVRYGKGLLEQGHRLRVRADIGAGEVQEASVVLHGRP